jgi:hypothetical protein
VMPPHSPRSIGFTNVEVSDIIYFYCLTVMIIHDSNCLLFWQHPLIGHDIYGDDLTAKALESCKKTVLHPYLGFLKVVSCCRRVCSPKTWCSCTR